MVTNKQRRVFGSAGHSTVQGKDRGAASKDGKYVEGVLAAEFRGMVYDYLMKAHNYRMSVDPDDSVFSKTISLFKKWTTPRCIVIDFHFNAVVDPKANGVETIVPKNASDFEVALANALSSAVNAGTGFQLRGSYRGARGVKDETQTAHKSLSWMRLTGENVLVELCFVSNPDEMVVWEKTKHMVAARVANVIFDFVNK